MLHIGRRGGIFSVYTSFVLNGSVRRRSSYFFRLLFCYL